MWKLRLCSKPSDSVTVLHGDPLTVSRQDGAALHLRDDPSISRQHAIVRVHHSLQAVRRGIASTLELEDTKSKNGSYIRRAGTTRDVFIESDRVSAGAKIQLQPGDVVRFGLYNHSFVVAQEHVLVATSMLSSSCTASLLRSLLQLGVAFSKEWNDRCTHLVMTSIKLTAKVACALASGAVIVTPEYFSCLLEHKSEKRSPPLSTSHYLPPITESGIQPCPSLFEPNRKRRQTLAGLHFIFASDQAYKKLSSIVIEAGGNSSVLCTEDLVKLVEGDAILVKTADDRLNNDSFRQAIQAVNSSGQNAVPESDLALAILYNSTERFCNPCLSQQQLLPSTRREIETSNLAVYVPETQNLTAAEPCVQASAAVEVNKICSSVSAITKTSVPPTPTNSLSSNALNANSEQSGLAPLKLKDSPLPLRQSPRLAQKRNNLDCDELAPASKRNCVDGLAMSKDDEEVWDHQEGARQFVESLTAEFVPRHYSTQITNCPPLVDQVMNTNDDIRNLHSLVDFDSQELLEREKMIHSDTRHPPSDRLVSSQMLNESTHSLETDDGVRHLNKLIKLEPESKNFPETRKDLSCKLQDVETRKVCKAARNDGLLVLPTASARSGRLRQQKLNSVLARGPISALQESDANKRLRSPVKQEAENLFGSSSSMQEEQRQETQNSTDDLKSPSDNGTQGFLNKSVTTNLKTTSGFYSGSSAETVPDLVTSVHNLTTVKNEAEVEHDQMPLNEKTKLCRTAIVSLVLKTSVCPPMNESANCDKSNFKRFIKVSFRKGGMSSPVLPRIIGDGDFVSHYRVAALEEDDISQYVLTPRINNKHPNQRSAWLLQHPEVSTMLEQEAREESHVNAEDAVDGHLNGHSSSATASRSEINRSRSDILNLVNTVAGSLHNNINHQNSTTTPAINTLFAIPATATRRSRR